MNVDGSFLSMMNMTQNIINNCYLECFILERSTLRKIFKTICLLIYVKFTIWIFGTPGVCISKVTIKELGCKGLAKAAWCLKICIKSRWESIRCFVWEGIKVTAVTTFIQLTEEYIIYIWSDRAKKYIGNYNTCGNLGELALTCTQLSQSS